MDRYNLLPSYYYKNNEDGIFEKSVGKPLRDYKIYGNLPNIILPEEYQQVEYIESTGAQYIDTDVKPTNNTVVEIKYASNLDASSYFMLYGSRTSVSSNDKHSFYKESNTGYYAGFGGDNLSGSGIYNTSSTELHTIKNGARGLYVDDILITTYQNYTFNSTLSMYLFGLNQANTLDSRTFKGKIYSCKIYEDSSLIRDFIPCYSKTDNVVGLYDIVNDVFYTNRGTGEFIEGDDILGNVKKNSGVGEKITNVVDIDHIIENNPSSTTSLYRVTFQDRDCLRWTAAGGAGNLRILQGKFKENTAYTIRVSVASSSTDGTFNVYYTDGTYVSVVFQNFAKGFAANNFYDIIVPTHDNKTIDYISGSWRNGQYQYIDISKFAITEGINKHHYIAENSSKYNLPIYCMRKNLANPNEVYSFVSKITSRTGYNYANTRVITDINGREILVNYAASGHGTTDYEETRKIFKGIFKPNTRYTISFDCYGQKDLNLGFLYTDGNYGVFSIPNYSDSSTVYKVSFTSALDKTIESIDLFYTSGSSYIYIDTIQIEEGTKATKYEPYGRYNVYLDKPLYKVDDYADYIDFKNQKVVRSIAEEIVDENTEFSILDTPIEESVVLPEIITQKGDCIVEVDTMVPPSKTEYQYYKGGS